MSTGTAVAILSSILGISSVIAACLLYIIRSEMKGDVMRLDGRINTHEAGCEQRQKSIDHRLESIDKKADKMDEKLDHLVARTRPD